MKNLKLVLIKEDSVFDILANNYDWDFGRGEGIALDIRSRRDGIEKRVGGVISSLLVPSEDKNLIGPNGRLLDYGKVILVARAYTSPEFAQDNNEFIITTDNYTNLMIRDASAAKVRDEIKRKLYIFFTERPTEYINGLSLYCSMYYDISTIRSSLALLKEIGDVEIKPQPGVWDARSIEHWHEQYKLNPNIYKEIEAQFEKAGQKILNTENSIPNKIEEFDFFISHASEDKETLVNELASAIAKEGFKVWYDDFVIKWGDSLRERIDEGLKASKYGIVILSRNFIREDKKWAHRELNALFAQEQKRKKILPIWYDIDEADIREFSPLLVDRRAMRSSDGIDKIIHEAKRLINP